MFRITLASVALLASAMTASVQASTVDPGPLALPPLAPQLIEGRFTLAPMAFVRFCLDFPDQCESTSPQAVDLSAERWRQLREVNATVNQRIVPRLGESDHWRLDARIGDCNDFAIQKRDELMRLGWPASALLLAAVQTRSGEYHLVLTVRTDRGDLVLDNLRASIVAWNRTGYRWLKRQSASQPKFWVLLDSGGRHVRVADNT